MKFVGPYGRPTNLAIVHITLLVEIRVPPWRACWCMINGRLPCNEREREREREKESDRKRERSRDADRLSTLTAACRARPPDA
jgi:hypothetical protein